MVLVTWLRPF